MNAEDLEFKRLRLKEELRKIEVELDASMANKDSQAIKEWIEKHQHRYFFQRMNDYTLRLFYIKDYNVTVVKHFHCSVLVIVYNNFDGRICEFRYEPDGKWGFRSTYDTNVIETLGLKEIEGSEFWALVTAYGLFTDKVREFHNEMESTE